MSLISDIILLAFSVHSAQNLKKSKLSSRVSHAFNIFKKIARRDVWQGFSSLY